MSKDKKIQVRLSLIFNNGSEKKPMSITHDVKGNSLFMATSQTVNVLKETPLIMENIIMEHLESFTINAAYKS